MSEKVRGKRVTIDLTPAAAAEVERIASIIGASTPDTFRASIGLLRLYVNAKAAGQDLVISDPKEPSKTRQLELAFPNKIGE